MDPGTQLCVVADTLQCIGKFVWHILPAVTGVLLGGFVINRFYVRKANVAGLVDRACDRLDELKESCADYWCSCPNSESPEDVKEAAVLEGKIKATVFHINALRGVLTKKYGLGSDLQAPITRLHDLCTGGSFESKERKADKQRFMKITRTIDDAAMEFQKLKL